MSDANSVGCRFYLLHILAASKVVLNVIETKCSKEFLGEIEGRVGEGRENSFRISNTLLTEPRLKPPVISFCSMDRVQKFFAVRENPPPSERTKQRCLRARLPSKHTNIHTKHNILNTVKLAWPPTHYCNLNDQTNHPTEIFIAQNLFKSH